MYYEISIPNLEPNLVIYNDKKFGNGAVERIILKCFQTNDYGVSMT
jgi:hypothetical protein